MNKILKYMADDIGVMKLVSPEFQSLDYLSWILDCDIVLRDGWYVILPSMFLEMS